MAVEGVVVATAVVVVGGGGGGCLNRRVREGERLNPFNIHKWVVSG